MYLFEFGKYDTVYSATEAWNLLSGKLHITSASGYDLSISAESLLSLFIIFIAAGDQKLYGCYF